MGCICPYPISSQEVLLISKERCLMLGGYSAAQLVKRIERVAEDGFVSQTHISQALMDLDEKKLSDVSDPAFQAYSKLMADGCFDADKLVALSVLMGSGQPSRKADLLFQHYSRQVKGLLNRQEAMRLLKDLLFVAVECLPLLAVRERLYEAVHRYITGLIYAAYDLVDSALEHLYRESSQLRQTEFASQFILLHDSAWLTPSGLRTYLSEHTKTATSRRRYRGMNDHLETISEAGLTMESTISS
jgi:hypothetical protein